MAWETAKTLQSRISAYRSGHADYVGWVMALVGPVAGAAVLDIGCGTGTFLEAVADAGAEAIVGLDVSSQMLEQARLACPKAQLLHQSLDEPWRLDRQFHVAMAIYSAYYSDDIPRLVGAGHEALLRGGRMVVVGPSPASSWEVRQHAHLGLTMTELRGNEGAAALVSAMASSFGSVSVQRRVNRLDFTDAQGFLDYYGSTALVRQMPESEQERARRLMRARAEEVLEREGHVLIDKEVWGLVGVKD